MKCPMVSITRDAQDCIEGKCYFWNLDYSKCKWMQTIWKNGFAKNVDIQWHSMDDLNSFITATISSVNSISHLWPEKDDKMNGDKKFKEIYDKFGGSYGDLIEEHLRVLTELEKCRQLLDEQTSKKI